MQFPSSSRFSPDPALLQLCSSPIEDLSNELRSERLAGRKRARRRCDGTLGQLSTKLTKRLLGGNVGRSLRVEAEWLRAQGEAGPAKWNDKGPRELDPPLSCPTRFTVARVPYSCCCIEIEKETWSLAGDLASSACARVKFKIRHLCWASFFLSPHALESSTCLAPLLLVDSRHLILRPASSSGVSRAPQRGENPS